MVLLTKLTARPMVLLLVATLTLTLSSILVATQRIHSLSSTMLRKCTLTVLRSSRQSAQSVMLRRKLGLMLTQRRLLLRQNGLAARLQRLIGASVYRRIMTLHVLLLLHVLAFLQSRFLIWFVLLPTFLTLIRQTVS